MTEFIILVLRHETTAPERLLRKSLESFFSFMNCTDNVSKSRVCRPAAHPMKDIFPFGKTGEMSIAAIYSGAYRMKHQNTIKTVNILA